MTGAQMVFSEKKKVVRVTNVSSKFQVWGCFCHLQSHSRKIYWWM